MIASQRVAWLRVKGEGVEGAEEEVAVVEEAEEDADEAEEDPDFFFLLLTLATGRKEAGGWMKYKNKIIF